MPAATPPAPTWQHLAYAIALALAAGLLCVACSAESRSRWTNPAAGIPGHPGGAPSIGYIEPIAEEPEEPEEPDADIELAEEAAAVDADAAGSAEPLQTGAEPVLDAGAPGSADAG